MMLGAARRVVTRKAACASWPLSRAWPSCPGQFGADLSENDVTRLYMAIASEAQAQAQHEAAARSRSLPPVRSALAELTSIAGAKTL
jgi:hypothetical protein